MRLGKRAALLAAMLLPLSACGPEDETWDRPLRLEGPVVAGDHLVWLRGATADLVALSAGESAAPLYLGLGPLVRSVAAVDGGVLACGGRGDAPWIQRVHLPDGEVVNLLPGAGATPVGAYDRIAVSPDGRWAVLFYDPARAPAPGGPAARNNNEVAIVDLAASTVKAVALRTESLAPQEVVYAGSLAAIVLDTTVVLLDLERPERFVRVPMPVSGDRIARPQKAVFAPDGGYLYLLTTDSNDVLAIEVHRTAQEIGAAVNFLFHPGTGPLLDIAVPSGEGFDRYVAALFGGSSPRAVLLDATGDASRSRFVELSRGSSLIDLGGGKMLVRGSGTEQARRFIAAWDPLGERVEEASLPGVPSEHIRHGEGISYFAHPAVGLGEAVSAALTAVTVEEQGARLRVRLNTLVLGGQPSATALDADGRSLVVALTVPRKDSGAAPRLGSVDDFTGSTGALVRIHADTLGLSGVALDEKVQRLEVLGDRLQAVHPDPLGDVTTLPLATLDRADAFRQTGFLAGQLFGAGGD